MKVLCIDASKSAGAIYAPPFKEGEILTATKSLSFDDCYIISEYPKLEGKNAPWLKARFIPLSNIDETELIKEREYENNLC